MRSRLTSLLKIFYSPHEAMADLSVRAPYIIGVALALVSTFVYYAAINQNIRRLLSTFTERGFTLLVSPRFNLFSEIGASISPVLFLVVVFVPACLFAANLIDKQSSFSVLLRQQYASMASCILY